MLILSQQDEVLSELKEYARSDPKPDDAPSVELTIAYLEALFQKSILGQRVRVFDPNGSTIQRMEASFKFFAQWAKEKPLDEVDSKQFFSWQVSFKNCSTFGEEILKLTHLYLEHTNTSTYAHFFRHGICSKLCGLDLKEWYKIFWQQILDIMLTHAD